MAIREGSAHVAPTGESALPDAAELPYARPPRAIPAIGRPSLRIGVTVGAVAIVVATAFISATLFAERLRELAVAGAVEHAEAIVRTNLDPAIGPDSLDMNHSLDPELDDQLSRLVLGGEMARIVVWSSDGRAVYSSDPALRGHRFSIGGELAEAFAGESVAEYGTEGDDETGLPGAAALPVPFLEIYVPIRGGIDGPAIGVYEVYQDARPIELLVTQTRESVLVLALAASGILFAVLWLTFTGASLLLTRQNRLLRERSVRDALTGLANHGFLLEELNRHLTTPDPNGAIALLDVDNFRLLNAGHGHRAGDEALRRVAAVLTAVAQPGQLYGRFGPDEFLLADFSEGAGRLMTTLTVVTAALSEVELRFGDSERLPLSVSVGVARVPHDGLRSLEVLSVAEAALREAKTSGGQVMKIADQSTIGSLAAQNTVFGVFEGLLVSVDTKDHYTRAHSEDVTGHALFLADALHLPEEDRRLIRLAGLLHDIGKIGIPDGILRKPAPLTAEEYDIVKQHVALGDAIVGAVPQLADVRAGVRHHHERWDGSGYLDGLQGEGIPRIARIIAVADAYSAMTTTRTYRKALSPDEALARVAEAAGTQLDPELAMTFVTAMRKARAAGHVTSKERLQLDAQPRSVTS
ncbi:MAG TPA: diguanylate cyclase [Candidatus Limnocylindria bacterium]